MDQFLAAADAHGATATAHEEDQIRAFKRRKLPRGGFLKLNECYDKLDAQFKTWVDHEMENTSNGYHCLLRLINVAKGATLVTQIMAPFIARYTVEDEVFNFENFKLGITLEDVLYLTGLPIKGKPVVAENSRDVNAYERVLEIESWGVDLKKLGEVANDEHKSNEIRMKALLLLVIHCVVVVGHENMVYREYVQFVENLEEVDSYAWGAAQLAHLQTGLNIGNRGCHWITQAFCFTRFPCLWTLFGESIPDIKDLPVPIIVSLSNKIGSSTSNHRRQIPILIANVQSLLTLENCVMQPYKDCELPAYLEDHANHVTYFGHLFCHKYAVKHTAYLVPQQFGVASFANIPELTPLPTVPKPQNNNYVQFYGDCLKAWNEQFVLPIEPEIVSKEPEVGQLNYVPPNEKEHENNENKIQKKNARGHKNKDGVVAVRRSARNCNPVHRHE